jgi:hypothetical protein
MGRLVLRRASRLLWLRLAGRRRGAQQMPSIFAGIAGTVIVLETLVKPPWPSATGYEAGPPSWGPPCMPTQSPPLQPWGGGAACLPRRLGGRRRSDFGWMQSWKATAGPSSSRSGVRRAIADQCSAVMPATAQHAEYT